MQINSNIVFIDEPFSTSIISYHFFERRQQFYEISLFFYYTSTKSYLGKVNLKHLIVFTDHDKIGTNWLIGDKIFLFNVNRSIFHRNTQNAVLRTIFIDSFLQHLNTLLKTAELVWIFLIVAQDLKFSNWGHHSVRNCWLVSY